MPNADFYRDLLLPECIIQVSTFDRVLSTIPSDSMERILQAYPQHELFFLGGVIPERRLERSQDTDIKLKNYFYIDLDIRKAHPEIEDQELKELAFLFAEKMKPDILFGQWRHIVFSGNGLHIYYFAKEPIRIISRGRWRLGLQEWNKKIGEFLHELVDMSCVNPSRLGRLPGSYNRKGEPRLCEVLLSQDKRINFDRIEQEGQRIETEIAAENIRRMEELKRILPANDGTYEAINAIPVGEIVVKIKGWDMRGKHFLAPGDRKEKACFVSEEKNVLIHGGTDHIESSAVGFGPFELVKSLLQLDNGGTFRWFKDQYPQIREISAKEHQAFNIAEPAVPIATIITPLSAIDSAFDELEATNFEQLLLGEGCEEFDANKILIRGAITRLGAFSRTGKSKMAYFLSYHLLKRGYTGILFSTEVPRSIVLANLIITHTGKHFWDIVNRRYKITDDDRKMFQNLSIYDVTHTTNSLQRFEEYIELHIKAGHKPDFVVIDFVQGVMPAGRALEEYAQMTRYALDSQAVAQKYNICILDLSQISNAGLHDEFASVGHIPFKGSGHLYSSADIGILMKRENGSNMMKFEVRKHKYMPSCSLDLECDLARGTFKIFGSEFQDSF